MALAQTNAPANNEPNSLTSDGTPMIMTVKDSFTGAEYEFTVNSTSQAVDIMNGIMSISQSAGSTLTEPLKKTFNAAVTELGVKPIVSGAKAQITGLFDSVKQLSKNTKTSNTRNETGALFDTVYSTPHRWELATSFI